MVHQARTERAERARRSGVLVGIGCEEKRHAGLTEHVPESLDGCVGDGGDVDGE